MQIKTLFVTSLIVPMLLIACNRATDQQQPLASGTSEERRAVAPADPGKTLESSPSAAGITAAPATPPMEPAPAVTAPATPPSEPAKSGY